MTPTPAAPQCSDGLDNDNDGQRDFPSDKGCVSAQDPSELDTIPPQGTPKCSDALDNDGDGKIDHPADPGCDSPQDDFEADNRGGGGGGGGGTKFVRSRVSINHDFSPHRFFGRVRSPLSRCERGRRVVVRKVTPGTDDFIGRDRTNRRGRWSVTAAHSAGSYYAKVRRKAFTAGGRRVVCRADRSRTISVTS
ncbi:MAG TPA: hypothetical protein VNC78_10570 [Actinomycetota bacterium]|nr:hypothetical protein [Actinomycetota bacterium]